MSGSTPAIGVWNPAFLGDAVLTLPLIEALARSFPGSAIDFYVRKGLEPLFSAQPGIRSVYACDKNRKGMASLIREGRTIRARHYDIWISAHTSPRSALVARLSGADRRIGYRGIGRKLCYTDTVDRCFGKLHETERILRLMQPLSQETFSSMPHLHLPSAALRSAQLWRAMADAPVVGLHPGSIWPTKRWTVEGFAAVAAEAARAGAVVAVFAGPGEDDLAREVIRLADVPTLQLHDFSSGMSLVSLAAHIACLDAYVTNDSGPMHLAWAQGVPVTAVFGPTTEDLGFFPRGDQSTVIQEDVPCRPCGLHGGKSCPKGDFRCMREIDPQRVWEDVRRKIFPEKSAEKKGVETL
ncbi:MAG: glycosyltransferase family 9 protein [Desulfovibrionaceae bacterium]|nr:glycosyltransferase family 9 protein [Desulfovibrionaceae bacterium]